MTQCRVLAGTREPDVVVRTWLNDQVAETLYLSSVTLAELLFGIRALPAGKRESMLDSTLTEPLELFEDRVLPFDTDAARHYADLAVMAKDGGRGFPTPEGYIAAIAASRYTSPYEAARVKVFNPWNDA